MNLIHLDTLDYPCSLWQVRLANPNVSFPSEPTDEDLVPFGYANVFPTPQPTDWDQRTQRLEEAIPTADSDGVYHQAWSLRDATAEEIAAWDTAFTQPDWSTFKSVVLTDTAINTTLAQALTTAPAAATALAPTLLRAEQGLIDDFATAWNAVLAVAPLPTGTLWLLVSLAQDCKLPAAFVAALTPKP